jgi:hypothetical protein
MKNFFYALLLISACMYAQTPYDFKAVFDADQKILSEIENRYLGDVSKLQLFADFADLNVSGGTETLLGEATLTQWKGNCTVTTVTRVTVKAYQNSIRFDMNAYKFVLANGSVYKYFSVAHQGVMDYAINSKAYSISYIAILAGLDEAYLDMKKMASGLLDHN